MVAFGKVALLLWALGMGYVGFNLVGGAGTAALNAFANGNTAEGLMQMTFVVLVALGTTAIVALFLIMGVMRE
jgi:hypothetical protein